MSGPEQIVDAKVFGAKGDGSTDDTAPLAAWIGAINEAPGVVAFLPPGQYMISGSLPPVRADSVVIHGCGWAYTNFRQGSVISAARAGGAQIIGCHFTPGSGVGRNSIWFNGSPNDVLIANCRFDNSIGSPVQISPVGSTPHNLAIANCLLQSKTLTADRYALVAVDTTDHSAAGGTWSRPTGPPTRPSPRSRIGHGCHGK